MVEPVDPFKGGYKPLVDRGRTTPFTFVDWLDLDVRVRQWVYYLRVGNRGSQAAVMVDIERSEGGLPVRASETSSWSPPCGDRQR